jgi:ADP-L-glycero-D-manno-heptose 6-epimerase
MRILITGHRGFIGGHAQEYFQHSAEVETLEWGDADPDLHGVDWVMHFGAISSTAERDVDRVLRQNYDYSRHLLDCCLAQGVNFQFSSSASVYGATDHFQESGPVSPQSPYAWSKYLFERYAQSRWSLAEFEGIHIQGFRYFNVYGTGEDHKDQPSPWTTFRRQAQTGVIRVFDIHPEPQRDFVPVERVIDLHHRFISVTESGIWNIGSGEPRTFLSIAQEIARETGAQIQRVPAPQHLLDQYQHYTCADLTKLNSTLAHYRV